MNTYDIDESTAERIESKVDTKVEQSVTNDKYSEYLAGLRKNYEGLPNKEETKELQENIPDEYKEQYYDKETHTEYKKVNPTQEEIKILAKKLGISEEIVKENYTKYAYYNALKEKNTIYQTKADFEKSQAELKEKIELETNPIKRAELKKGLYKKVLDSFSLYHNIKLDENGEPYIDASFPNEKYVNAQREEAIFSKENGIWIDDGINNETYNIGVWEKNLIFRNLSVHMRDKKGDVKLWLEYGVGPNDRLTKEQRKKITKDANIIYFNKKAFEIAEEKLKNRNKNRK